MKTFVTTFALSLALCAAVGATAQTKSGAPESVPDSVLLSEETDGDYLVRKFIVNRADDKGYSIRYRINMARLISTLADNSSELTDLNDFVEGVLNDTLMHVRSVQITGYASPDGPLAFNRTLARNRMNDFRNYVDRKYHLSKKYSVSTSSEVEGWDACRPMVERSNMPDKQAVLRAIAGSGAPEGIQKQLEAMPAAWEYLKTDVLPPLRRVEMTINYTKGSIVEQRTLINPQPEIVEIEEEREVVIECPCIDEGITGLIVEMPEEQVDFERGYVGGPLSQEAREAEMMAKREARAADRIAREEMRAAKKIAKKEAKAARKAEKAARKAARQAEKALP